MTWTWSLCDVMWWSGLVANWLYSVLFCVPAWPGSQGPQGIEIEMDNFHKGKYRMVKLNWCVHFRDSQFWRSHLRASRIHLWFYIKTHSLIHHRNSFLDLTFSGNQPFLAAKNFILDNILAAAKDKLLYLRSSPHHVEDLNLLVPYQTSNAIGLDPFSQMTISNS